MASSDKPRGFTVSIAEDPFDDLIKLNEEELTDSTQEGSSYVLQSAVSSRELQMGSAVFKSSPAASEMISEEFIAQIIYENSNLVKEIKTWQDSVKNLKGQLHEGDKMFLSLSSELANERCRYITLYQSHRKKSSALVEAKEKAKELQDFINYMRHKNFILASSMCAEKKPGVFKRLKKKLAKGFQGIRRRREKEMHDKDKKNRGVFKRLKKMLEELRDVFDSQALFLCVPSEYIHVFII